MILYAFTTFDFDKFHANFLILNDENEEEFFLMLKFLAKLGRWGDEKKEISLFLLMVWANHIIGLPEYSSLTHMDKVKKTILEHINLSEQLSFKTFLEIAQKCYLINI